MNHIRLVFSNYPYTVLSVVIFSLLLFPLLLLSGYLFFEPYVVGYISPGSEFELFLIVVMSSLSGMVIPMNIYRIRALHASRKKISGSIFGAMIGSVTGACSCSSAGLVFFSTIVSLGAITTFLSNYKTVIHIAAIAILFITYYTTVISLRNECKINR